VDRNGSTRPAGILPTCILPAGSARSPPYRVAYPACLPASVPRTCGPDNLRTGRAWGRRHISSCYNLLPDRTLFLLAVASARHGRTQRTYAFAHVAVAYTMDVCLWFATGRNVCSLRRFSAYLRDTHVDDDGATLYNIGAACAALALPKLGC